MISFFFIFDTKGWIEKKIMTPQCNLVLFLFLFFFFPCYFFRSSVTKFGSRLMVPTVGWGSGREKNDVFIQSG